MSDWVKDVEKVSKSLLDNQKEYESLTFEEAMKYFGDKLVIKSQSFYRLKNDYKTKAFTISGYTSLDMLSKFHKELEKALKEGLTAKDFRESMNDFLERKGYEGLTPYQSDNIFRTNIQTAYSVGRHAQLSTPAVTKYRPYWMYDAVDDSKTRPSHRLMDGKVFRYDHPVWDTWYPPNGFRCRCKVRSLSERQVKERGLTVSEELDQVMEDKKTGMVIQMLPDKNFSYNPAKEAFNPDISKYPKSFQRAWQERNKNK